MHFKPALLLTSATQMTGDVVRSIKRGDLAAALMMGGGQVYSAVIAYDAPAREVLARNENQWSVAKAIDHKDKLKDPQNFTGLNAIVSLRGGNPNFLIVSTRLLNVFGHSPESLRAARPHNPAEIFNVIKDGENFVLRHDRVASKFMKAAMGLNSEQMIMTARGSRGVFKDFDL